LSHPEVPRALWLLKGQQNGNNDAGIEVELQGHSIAARSRRLSNFICGRMNLREGIAINSLGLWRHKGGIRSGFILRAAGSARAIAGADRAINTEAEAARTILRMMKSFSWMC
jgi:hypothetical protein